MQDKQEEKKKVSLLDWAKFIIGALVFMGLGYAQFILGKEVNLVWVLITGLLMGLDPSSFFNGLKK